MALKKLYITTVAGTTSVYHPELLYADVMQVRRESKMQVPGEADAIPTNRFFLFVPWEGKIYFDPNRPFELQPPPFGRYIPQHEKVYVLYKTA